MMDIRYLGHNDIDRKRWDHCIESAINGNIYAYSWYLDTVCDRWDALVGDDYDTVFPLTRKKKFGFDYLYQPAFSQQLGVFTRGHLTPQIVDEFLSLIPANFKLIEIQLNSFNNPSQSSFQIRLRPNLELELISDYQSITKNYSENTRRNLKSGLASGWTVINHASLDTLIRIFRSNRGKELKTLKQEDYTRLETLIRECIKRNCVKVLGARKEGSEMHAGAVFVRSHKKLIFLFSATDAVARKEGAMPLIINKMIQDNSSTDQILDFEGSEDPGLARFYRSFGAKELHYPFISRDTLPWWIRYGRKMTR
ncbi:MAG: GNAT family N-acetyltransferase [Bacteroidetes bacterium]|nr:GNAT family N-acetyltransferase [Bacteroidota bacterium]